ncbi:hypothetical protein F4810DRAFT_680708 [Camillea tinctor]|nr:hypothetical protein F4810DRAFT_680708 [Camillea tinctor]
MPLEGPIPTSGRIVLAKPGARPASYSGHGITEVLDIIKILEDAGICCCVTGGHALNYYGAKLVPMDWQICVSDDHFDKASAMFQSKPLNEVYEPWVKIQPQIRTLMHTYPRYTLKGVNFFFFLVPAFEYCMQWGTSDLERSQQNIPYPKLQLFAQSLLDTQRQLDLTNLVDGMDLSEEWGNEHLDLDKPGELEYAKEKNKRLIAACGGRPEISVPQLRVTPRDLRQEWQKIVREKKQRIGIKLSSHMYLTRFRLVGSRDPRLLERVYI